MAMDLDPNTGKNGVQVVKLEFVWKLVLSVMSAAFAVALGYLVAKVNKIDAIDTRTQVTNTTVDAVKENLTDLPTIRSTQTKLVEQVKQLEKNDAEIRADVTELQKLKGLR